MKVEKSIREKIERAFSPEYFELENESSKHHVPQGSESHFRVLIVSDVFDKMSRVERARKLHELLGDEFKTGMHALSERIYTSQEWGRLSDPQKLMISPNCLGGSKKKLAP